MQLGEITDRSIRCVPQDTFKHDQIFTADQAELLKQFAIGANAGENLDHRCCNFMPHRQKVIKEPGIAQQLGDQRVRGQSARIKGWIIWIAKEDIFGNSDVDIVDIRIKRHELKAFGADLFARF